MLPRSGPPANDAKPYQCAEIHSEDDDRASILCEDGAIVNIGAETAGGIDRAVSACHIGSAREQCMRCR